MSLNSEFKKTYQSYSDDQLVQLIAKSGSDLVEEAFEALVEEIDARGLKTAQSQELDGRIKLIQRRHKQNLLKRNIYDAKLAGAGNDSLKTTLLNGGFSEEESDKIILRLPNLEFNNEEFVNFIKLKAEATRNKFILNLAFFSMGILGFFVFGISESFGLAFFLAGVLLALGLVYMLANIDNLIKPDFWLDLIKSKPYEFVWIKPIRIKTKLYFVLTINTENFFELKTTRGRTLTVECKTNADNRIFLEGIRNCLTHVHFGYDEESQKYFSQDPDKFIESLEKNDLYRPIDSVLVEG